MDGIKALKHYRENKSDYLPLIDHADKIFSSRSGNGDINIGWNCGFIGNRPFFSELWATSGITVLTVFMSTIGIEDCSISDIETLLIEEARYYTKLEGYVSPSTMPKFKDHNGNEFYSINITVGFEDEDALIDGGIIYPFAMLNEFNAPPAAKEKKEKKEITYFLIHEEILAKSEKGEGHVDDYLFKDGKWIKDTDLVLMHHLAGFDPTELADSSNFTGDPDILKEINVISEEKAVSIMNPEILEILKNKWTEEAVARKNDREHWPGWFSKLVSSEFCLNGIEYTIKPEDIGLSHNGQEQAMMEIMLTKMEKDLIEYGATHIRSYGCID